MKVGGRIIRVQNQFDLENEIEFTYKKHDVIIKVQQKLEHANDIYYAEIKKKNKIVYRGSVQRCNIKDALHYSLTQAKL